MMEDIITLQKHLNLYEHVRKISLFIFVPTAVTCIILALRYDLLNKEDPYTENMLESVILYWPLFIIQFIAYTGLIWSSFHKHYVVKLLSFANNFKVQQETNSTEANTTA